MPTLQTDDLKETRQRESTGSSAERRASVERLRAVGQTFADGLAALRSHVTNKPMPSRAPESTQQPSVERDASFVSPPRDNSPNQTQTVTALPVEESQHIARLSTLLEAADARTEAAQHELKRLRRENETLRQTADRSARLLGALRAEYDILVEESQHKTSKEEQAIADAARLRAELVEVERQLQQVSQRATQTDRALAEEKQKSRALERVCMGLRRRVAVAEDKAQDATRLQEAIVARDTAESRLAEIRAEAERLRARCGATDVLRERAEAAERAERSLRDRLIALEKEVESREALLRQGLLERRRLKDYLTKCERQLEQKDYKIAKLRRSAKRFKNDDRPLPLPDDETSIATDPPLSMDKLDTPTDEYGDHRLEVSQTGNM